MAVERPGTVQSNTLCCPLQQQRIRSEENVTVLNSLKCRLFSPAIELRGLNEAMQRPPRQVRSNERGRLIACGARCEAHFDVRRSVGARCEVRLARCGRRLGRGIRDHMSVALSGLVPTKESGFAEAALWEAQNLEPLAAAQ